MIKSRSSSYNITPEIKDGSTQRQKLWCSFRSAILCVFVLIYSIVTINTFFTMTDFIGSSEVMHGNDDDDGLILEAVQQEAVQQQQLFQSSSMTDTKWKQLKRHKRKDKITKQGIDAKKNGVIATNEMHNQQQHHVNNIDASTKTTKTTKRSLQFLHIPKNAGSTITDSAKAANIVSSIII